MIPRYQNWSLAGDVRAQRRVVNFLAKQYGDEEQTVMSGTDDYSADASIQYNTLEKKLLLFIALCMEAEADIEQEADAPFQPENPQPMDDGGDDDNDHDDDGTQSMDEDDEYILNSRNDNDENAPAPPAPPQGPSSRGSKRNRDNEPFTPSKIRKQTKRGIKRERTHTLLFPQNKKPRYVPAPTVIPPIIKETHEIYPPKDGPFSRPNPSKKASKPLGKPVLKRATVLGKTKLEPSAYMPSSKKSGPFSAPVKPAQQRKVDVKPYKSREYISRQKGDKRQKVYVSTSRRFKDIGPFSRDDLGVIKDFGGARMSGGSIRYSGQFAGILKNMLGVLGDCLQLLRQMTDTFSFLNKQQVENLSQLLNRSLNTFHRLSNIFHVHVQDFDFNIQSKVQLLNEVQNVLSDVYSQSRNFIDNYIPAVVRIPASSSFDADNGSYSAMPRRSK
jgi:hypothetical protein